MSSGISRVRLTAIFTFFMWVQRVNRKTKFSGSCFLCAVTDMVMTSDCYDFFYSLNDSHNLRGKSPMPKPDAANPRQVDARVLRILNISS